MNARTTRRLIRSLYGLAGILSFAGGASSAVAADTPGDVELNAPGVAAISAEPPAEASAPAAPEPSDRSWQFSVTPYFWMSGLNGDVGVFPALQPVDVDMSFGDIWDNLKFAGMVMLQARRDRFVALADIEYIHLGTAKDIGIRDPGFVAADLDVETFSGTVAGGYRAVDRGAMSFDILGGARITATDTRLELAGPNRAIVGDSSKTWVDPVVGARFNAPLGEKWALALYGDIGGFGVSSDLTWQLLGTIQYQLGQSWWLSAGWRQYAIDYENDGFIYDVSMGGPIVGVSYRF